jgi:hypothetical protein
MAEMMALLADNSLLLSGLVVGLAVIALRMVAKKTENTLDDKGVELLEQHKVSVVAKAAALMKRLLKK